MGDNIHITWFGVSAIVSGLIFFYVLKTHIEPWAIETVCRELIRCDS
jgi:hypothetical protein